MVQSDYPLRLGPKIDKWPVNEQAVEELIAAREVTTLEDLAHEEALQEACLSLNTCSGMNDRTNHI